uniref:DNA-binding transcriptional regulator NtrC n=1 Tax=Eiseniibacteriota bacterium TaxID=2212470 RepID=A0A832I683_UNCEI
MSGGARGTVLVVEDDRDMRVLLEDELGAEGWTVVTAANGDEALARFREGRVDAVVTDLQMPGMKGDRLLAEVRALERDVPVVIMTAFGTIESAVSAMKGGAYHYLAKPFRIEQLVATLARAMEERALRHALVARAAEAGAGEGRIVAESPAMRRTLEMVALAAGADAPVLLLGESGTGKELLARALHAASARRERPFVTLNCAAIPETLLESQLFGYRRGAFTDAREDRAGVLQEAEGGTVLLDEIGDMPLALQAKVLRLLQNREIHPLGAAAPVTVDVRLVAATHRDLEALCAEGRFRRDLYYRLNVLPVRVPPLRERLEDLVPLAGHFLAVHGRTTGREGVTLSLEAMELLRRHAWPGNVRELENAILRALVIGSGRAIGPEDLPEHIRPARAGAEGERVRLLAEVEKEQVLRALRAVGGNKAAAARLLGLDRKTLYRKLEQYGVEG